jgi:DNA (cytosine-5)-methyltransferase 1
MSSRKVNAVDMFCGAGGTSYGLLRACKALGINVELLAINHWEIAIETHSLNHPYAKHICQSIDLVNPRKEVPSGRLRIMVASPECTHHSIARGGRPINDQMRVSAWQILKWAQELYIESILIENVKEFAKWGPLGASGHPMRGRQGETYRAFLEALRSLGYRVEDRVLNAAYFGDATSRERLFIMARRGGKKIVWPEPSHGPITDQMSFTTHKPWRTAREIIDWDLKGSSIFGRKRPLAPNTMSRIVAGLRKFGGQDIEPYLVILRNNMSSRSVDEPLPTLTAGGKHFGLCEPFLLGQQSGGAPRSVNDPVPTVATDGAISLCEPFLVPQFNEAPPKSVDEPLGTITTTSRGIRLIEPFIVPIDNGSSADGGARSVNDPLSTIVTKDRHALVDPYIVSVNHGGGEERRAHPVSEPVPVITTKNGYALVEPLLVKYYGNEKDVQPVTEPLDTVTTKGRFGLVTNECDGYRLDIRFRMLQTHELAAAQGFISGPKAKDEYIFQGTKSDQTKQIGNAVPVNLAAALCTALLQ